MAGINDGYSSQLFSGLLAARGINSAQINGGISAAIAGQNAANKANQQRYDQGLSTLQGGSDKAAGLLQSATDQIQNNGQAAANRINLQEQQGLGNATQSAVSRGLSDSTISDAMQRGVSRDANDARLANQELINRQQSQAKDLQASQASQGAGAVSNFIAARDDTGPNMGLLSQMIMGAASNPATQRTGSVQRQSVPPNSNGLPSNFGNAPAASGGGYVMGPGGQASAYGANAASSLPMMGAGGGGGGGSPGAVQSALTPSGADSSISNAITGTAPGADLAADAKGASAWTSPEVAGALAKGQAQAAGATLPYANDDGSPFMGSGTTGYFTRTQWSALSPDQQKNVLAGRRPDQGVQ